MARGQGVNPFGMPTDAQPISDTRGIVTIPWRLYLAKFGQTLVNTYVTHTGNLTVDHLVLGNGGGDIKSIAAHDGEVPIGSTADGTVVASTLTAGAGIAITNAAHSITIRATGAASLIPLVTGAEPPVLVSDGAGHLILVPAA
jgi:hypothetical protein